MQSGKMKPISIENLLIDLHNPRYDIRNSQREALTTIAHDQGLKLVNLAEDIIDKGLNPSEVVMVTPFDESSYVVLEGNRRIAALKLISSISLLDSVGLSQRLAKRLKALHDQAKGELPTQINCVVLSREDANYWIQLKHTGENEGVGVVPWDGQARHRFRGNSPALQAVELVDKSNYINDETRKKLPKIAITNIERVLGTPDARKQLGVDVINRKLILKSPEDDALARLAIIVTDIAHGIMKVTHLDTKQQRVNYAADVAGRPLPKPHIPGTGAKSGTSSGATPGRIAHKISPERKALIPRQLRLSIPQTRINRIYHELQSLDVDKFINACAVMFRVFVEMSVDDFAQRRKIPLLAPVSKKPGIVPPQMREMSLRAKLITISNYLEREKLCNKDELRGVRTLISNTNHVLSVDTLNAYVHNKHYNPTPSELKGNWDNIETFVERLWIS